MENCIKYIIQFLLGEQNLHLAGKVGYAMCSDAPVVIIPSGFFYEDVYLTPDSMPCLPLEEIEGVPLLFGKGKVKRNGRQMVVYADIIASTYFMVTRYEECMNHQDRDIYGRLTGTKSLPYRAGFIMRPIVDEYGRLLRRWLRETGNDAAEPPASFRHLYLTHDVDEIWQWDNLYRALRTFVKRVFCHKPDIFESLKAWFSYKAYDKIYTFPWLSDLDQSISRRIGAEKCTSVYFFKGGGNSPLDNAYYKKTRRIKRLARDLKAKGAVFGIHASMSAGQVPQRIRDEKKRLEHILKEKVTWNRNHYLCSREPEDMEYLAAAGITDDFTMGYADVTGFRLGTCRAVRYIDPIKKELTSLTLHPLTIMECTLDAEQYMNLDEEEAFGVILKMLEIAREYHGEVVLLWHNTSVAERAGSYQRQLYQRTLEYFVKKSF